MNNCIYNSVRRLKFSVLTVEQIDCITFRVRAGNDLSGSRKGHYSSAIGAPNEQSLLPMILIVGSTLGD